MHRESDSTPRLLTQWGRWAWTAHGLHLGYPHMAPFRRLSKTTSAPSPMISDLCGQAIDAAVARVSHANREAGACLVRYYLLGQTFSRVGKHLGVSRHRAAALTRLAEAAVSELLDAAE